MLGLCGSLVIIWQLVLSANSILLAETPSADAAIFSAEHEEMLFPIAVSGTYLIAQYPVSYEGPYVEDGSYEHMVDVAAIVLFNTARTGIEEARVVLQWEQGEYVFEAQMLPPRAAVMVLDKAGQKFDQHSWTVCYGSQKIGEGEWLGPQDLLVNETGDTEISVKNASDTRMQNIRIYYKSYLFPDGIYIGGITYCLGIEELEPGASITVQPYRYVKNYAKIVRTKYGS